MDGYRGVATLRPEIDSSRTWEADVDLRVDIVREPATGLGAAAAVWRAIASFRCQRTVLVLMPSCMAMSLVV